MKVQTQYIRLKKAKLQVLHVSAIYNTTNNFFFYIFFF